MNKVCCCRNRFRNFNSQPNRNRNLTNKHLHSHIYFLSPSFFRSISLCRSHCIATYARLLLLATRLLCSSISLHHEITFQCLDSVTMLSIFFQKAFVLTKKKKKSSFYMCLKQFREMMNFNRISLLSFSSFSFEIIERRRTDKRTNNRTSVILQ